AGGWGEDAIKPWQYQSWIFITDPNFAAKAARVLDLYARVWDGKPLSANDYVISADEKTSIQARCWCHPCLAPGKAADDAGQPRLPPRRRAGLPGLPTTSTGPPSRAGVTRQLGSDRSPR
ncbi:MAG: hypothetical protein ACYDC9_01240, partial [Dermatophilaceae bacterium]